ncbi:MAG: GH3 auxin-responsive promoter family protein [Lachnospiraceae bacterium]|nr:GH3 auxin-responsive promoter family protein [Lachnospiraceae bacterium]
MAKNTMGAGITYQANLQDAETGKAVYAAVNEEFKKGPELNEELLMRILRENKDTEYGRKYGFSDISSVEEYQNRVPVIVYDNIANDLERMSNGQKNILTAYTFTHMNETSATMGIPKRIPMTQAQAQVFLRYNKQYMDGLKAELLDSTWMAGRAFCTTEGKHRTLDSGITVGDASSVMADYIRGGKESLGNMMSALFTSPIEATLPVPNTDTKYIHTRAALMDENATGIITGFYSLVLNYLRYIGDHYELLIHDIEKGTIDADIKLSPEVRESLLQKIQPMPERAARLREIFANGSDFCFIPEVWPQMTYLTGVGGDGFRIYDRIIKERYSGDCLKNIYFGVTASEGLWSVPGGIDIEDSVLAPSSAFLEFLPVDCGDNFSRCVTMDKLEKGRIYEIIATNLSGFYRYRTSDAVEVTGFREQTPTVRFMYRVNRTINMAAEKTTEKALQVAVEGAMEELGVELSDFSVYPDYDNMTYVFLVEPMKEDVGVNEQQLTDCIYKHMRKANGEFAGYVDTGRIKRPVAHWLQSQTATLYRDMMVFKGASANQLKPVRVIMNEKQRKFFFGLLME